MPRQLQESPHFLSSIRRITALESVLDAGLIEISFHLGAPSTSRLAVDDYFTTSYSLFSFLLQDLSCCLLLLYSSGRLASSIGVVVAHYHIANLGVFCVVCILDGHAFKSSVGELGSSRSSLIAVVHVQFADL